MDTYNPGKITYAVGVSLLRNFLQYVYLCVTLYSFPVDAFHQERLSYPRVSLECTGFAPPSWNESTLIASRGLFPLCALPNLDDLPLRIFSLRPLMVIICLHNKNNNGDSPRETIVLLNFDICFSTF